MGLEKVQTEGIEEIKSKKQEPGNSYLRKKKGAATSFLVGQPIVCMWNCQEMPTLLICLVSSARQAQSSVGGSRRAPAPLRAKPAERPLRYYERRVDYPPSLGKGFGAPMIGKSEAQS